MKNLLAMTLLVSIVSVTAFAEEAKTEVKTDSKKEAKQAVKEAYKKAKAACLVENKDLKGRELKDCIVKKQNEAK